MHALISLNTFMCRDHSIHISCSSNMEIVISDETTVAKLNLKSKMKLMNLGPFIQGFILKSHNLGQFFYGVYSNIFYNFPFPFVQTCLDCGLSSLISCSATFVTVHVNCRLSGLMKLNIRRWIFLFRPAKFWDNRN